MKKFPGFPDRMRYTSVPNVFFSSLLVEMDDLAELKVALHLLRLLYEKRGFAPLWSDPQRAASSAPADNSADQPQPGASSADTSG